jgi:putative heme-binding domain-containing protein
MNSNTNAIRVGSVVTGPTLPEPVEVLASVPMGESLKVIGRGRNTGMTYDPVLTPKQLAQLTISADREPFDGDARMFRLGIEAQRLGLAYEYDPFFALSIARVDPLPHQLEAVYSYFMKLPRIRFLLADDPGAGKTIMAGLLLKELKARGLVKRILIVAPASLTFQWQREMADKFREKFEVIRGDVLRANYGQNPWQERDQVVTSVSWGSVVEDARESLLRSRWDLVIVDEAHKMSARSEDHKTYAYRLGESLSKMTDHFLLMTATPHKGDPDHFRRFLALLDSDVYGSIESLEQAMREHEAPFYLRRTKEALVTFPDPQTGDVHKLFTKREVRSAAFELDGEELVFYDALTRYVEDQSIMAAADQSARGRAVGFTMAMLQRRMASSVYAVRRSLERMRTRREKILADPEAYRQEQIQRKVPDDFDELDAEEQQQIIDQLEGEVLSVDPTVLREEIARLSSLVEQAKPLETRDVQTKLLKLRSVLNEEGIFDDPSMKLLIFTEHKDTLDFLAGNGKDGRPLGKLIEWRLTVTQIHGGMKIGDRDTPGTRIYAEREFKESCQLLVATEATGEGINLQFCWLMINFDIPWNPVRLEQRVGRIHRYGQEKDCLIFNFVAQNTREGRVLRKLLDRLAEIRQDLGSDQVLDVVGEVATKAVSLLGYVGNQEAMEILKPLVIDNQRTRPLRTAAANALGRSRLGERYLLQVVQDGKLPADLNFTVANVLYASTDDSIRTEVAKHLTLPATAGSKTLPPVAELVKRSGDPARGHELFKTTATCSKCHKVRGEGKEVGPDLSEIGSKLPKEAMFISILDPNAGISHNYETYSAILDSGNIVSGLKVNETDDSVTIRSAESIDKVIAKDEIEELVKSSVSLMPADLQKTMSEQDLVDVVEYISTLKKTGA